jgi:haloalkane dehalogenase
MKFIAPTAEELSYLRADPLLWEQELDMRPDVAEAIEQATGMRAGRVYWRSDHDHLYALELADLGRGRPSMVMVYGFWDRYEPRPPEHEIDTDLLHFMIWVAEITQSIDPSDVERVAQFAHKQTGRVQTAWTEGSVLHTPEERFADLPGFPYEPRYVEIEGLRMAYVERGAGDPILMLHGEPTWGYLYRKMIPILSEVGRVIVPDMIGFGRSDKPVADNAYSYKAHVRWMRKFIQALDLQHITLVCQDWGGLIGLRVVAQIPGRFGRLVPMNTGIPYGRGASGSEAFMDWRRYSQQQRELDVMEVMKKLGGCSLTDAEAAAYRAPFPSKEYQTSALVFPRLVPTRPDHPGSYDNLIAVERLKTLNLPVLLPWADGDPITREGERVLRRIFSNCAPPLTIAGAGHFIQEDAGEEVAKHIRTWMASTSKV